MTAFHDLRPGFIITKIAYPGSYKDNPPSHYYENSTSRSKNKNIAEIAQGVVKSQEKYRDDILTAHDI